MNEAPPLHDRLLFWATAAYVASMVASLVMFDLSLASWVTGVLLSLLVLPAMLIQRALINLARGQSNDLYVNGRVLLPSALALVVPALALAILTGLREQGIVTANLYFGRISITRTSSSARSKGQLMNAPALPTGLVAVDRGGLQIYAGEGPLAEALIASIPHISSMTGYLQIELEPPSARMPIWKNTQLAAKVHGVLQLRQAGDRTRLISSKLEVTIEGTWAMTGFASQRDFHLYLGNSLGKECCDALLAEAKLMREL